MNQKVMVGILLILIFIVCMGIGYQLYKIKELSNTKIEQMTQVAKEQKITDECTEEASMLTNQMTEKVSPNAIFILKREFEGCHHTTKEYVGVPQNAVNKTEEELKNIYPEWEIQGFSNQEVVLLRKQPRYLS